VNILKKKTALEISDEIGFYGMQSKKDNILEMVQGFKMLAITDFAQLSDDEKEENKKYQRGYINALNMVYEQLKKNL
jgi:hypothetical protein